MIRKRLLSESISEALAPARWPLSEAEQRDLQGQMQLERLMRAFCQSASDEIMKMLGFMEQRRAERGEKLEGLLGADRE